MLAQQFTNLVERMKTLWCQVFHDAAMWPINGHYQCRTCLRYHPIRWDECQDRGGYRFANLRTGSAEHQQVAAPQAVLQSY